MLTVIAEIICHSEQDLKTVLDSFHHIREQVLQELGCHTYDVHIDHPAVKSALRTKVPFSIMMYEKWQSMQQHAKATEGAVASVKIRILEAQ